MNSLPVAAPLDTDFAGRGSHICLRVTPQLKPAVS